jgi:hypothetical protein
LRLEIVLSGPPGLRRFSAFRPSRFDGGLPFRDGETGSKARVPKPSSSAPTIAGHRPDADFSNVLFIDGNLDASA